MHFCKKLLAYSVAKDVTMCIFCKRKLCVLFSLPYWKGCYYVHFFAKNLHVFIGLPCWKGRHYVHILQKTVPLLAYPVEKGVTMCIFAKRKKRLCPRWHTLLKAASLRAFVFSNKINVFVGLPCWKWRHYVHFSCNAYYGFYLLSILWK